MASKRPLQEVDPLSLPVGLSVGRWRVKGWRGHGSYGTLYCVACWYRLADAKHPCKEEGKEDAYAWKGACYGPSYPTGREPNFEFAVTGHRRQEHTQPTS
jgi:hypothetical protein